jgi:phosphoglycerate dehydrogenase-like enzyme
VTGVQTCALPILTPHIAGITQQSEKRVNQLVVERVLEVLANR